MRIRFTVKDNENQPVESAKVNIKYGLTDTILLIMHPQGRFNNVEGDLTVEYDTSIGNLQGRGGAVESFSHDFTPVGLEPKPNPGLYEALRSKTGASTIEFTPVIYTSAYDDKDKISASPGEVVIEFKDSGIINP